MIKIRQHNYFFQTSEQGLTDVFLCWNAWYSTKNSSWPWKFQQYPDCGFPCTEKVWSYYIYTCYFYKKQNIPIETFTTYPPIYPINSLLPTSNGAQVRLPNMLWCMEHNMLRIPGVFRYKYYKDWGWCYWTEVKNFS